MGGRSDVTTAPAPTTAPLPMETPAVTIAWAPSHTSSPMWIGASLLAKVDRSLLPIELAFSQTEQMLQAI